MDIDAKNAGSALGGVRKPMQEDMFGESLEEARFRAEGMVTGKRGVAASRAVAVPRAEEGFNLKERKEHKGLR